MKDKKEVQNGKIWLKRELGAYRPYILFLSCLTVLSTLLSLSFAYLIGYLINSASAKDAKKLIWIAVLLLGLLLGRIFVNILNNYLSEKGRTKITTELRAKSFSKILRSDYKHIEKYHSGELLTRLTSDVQEVAGDTIGLAPTVTGMIVQCIGAVLALLTIDPLFTLVFLVAGCAFGGLVTLFRKKIKKYQKELLEVDGATRSFMQEGVSSLLTVKAYGAERKTTNRAQGFLDTYFAKRMQRNVLRSTMSGIFSLLSNFGLIFAVVWCSFSIYRGETNDYGSVLSVVLLLQQLQQPLTSFTSVIPVFYSRLVSCERLAEIEKLPDEDSELLKVKELYGDFSGFEIKDLSFGYGREEVLMDVDLFIPKGKIVCITGSSGSGKSTLFKLLLNVYHPTKGGIFLAGLDEERILSLKERALFAYVPQGNFLFSGTIYENMTFFCDGEVSETQIRDAIETACAQFVYELPDGLNTSLSERGAGLSEGQLQRLALVRALLSNRPVLLLDEATSALDGETETALLENLKKLEDKTCLIVTHRPAALSIADLVLRVEEGKIR